jgi:competence protein ComGF
LIEAIISLAVLLMLTSIIPMIFIPIQKKPPVSQLEDTSLFFTMLGKEIREATSLEVKNNNLYIMNVNNDVLSFSKYQSLVRKQVNGLGHEVWLQNISEMMMKNQSDGLIEVSIIDTDGRKYERVFWRME